jgi:hypothetical protein
LVGTPSTHFPTGVQRVEFVPGANPAPKSGDAGLFLIVPTLFQFATLIVMLPPLWT